MEEQTRGVKTFISLLLREYNNLEEEKLNSIWKNYVNQQKPEFTFSELNKFRKKDLESLCKSQNILHTGTKQVLICRLLGDNKIVAQKKSKKQTTKYQMIKNTEVIKIHKNVHGNYEHLESGLVFDEINKKVIGKQHSDGSVMPLSTDDIEFCRVRMFDYEIPYTFRNIYEN